MIPKSQWNFKVKSVLDLVAANKFVEACQHVSMHQDNISVLQAKEIVDYIIKSNLSDNFFEYQSGKVFNPQHYSILLREFGFKQSDESNIWTHPEYGTIAMHDMNYPDLLQKLIKLGEQRIITLIKNVFEIET